MRIFLSLPQITGLDTNVNFLIDLASHPSFQAGDVHTGFIDQHLNTLFPPIEISEQTVCQAVAALITNEKIESQNLATKQGRSGDPWTMCDGFRVNSTHTRDLQLESNGKKYDITLKYLNAGYEIRIDNGEAKPFTVKTIADANRFTMKMNFGGVESIFSSVITDNHIDIFNEVWKKTFLYNFSRFVKLNISFFPLPIFKNGRTQLNEVLPKFLSEISAGESTSSTSTVLSPMPGVCDKILVKPGDHVEANQPVAVIIAMKMEYVLKAPRDGVVEKVNASVGKSVAKGDVIVAFQEEVEKEDGHQQQQ